MTEQTEITEETENTQPRMDTKQHEY
jgi:hypothetical protein